MQSIPSMLKKFLAAVLAALLTAGMVSCAFSEESSVADTTTTKATTEQRRIETTKTATQNGKYDEDDEDYEGYTTTSSVTAGTLENPDVSIDDGYDQDIIATATKRTTTTTTTTTAATTTKKTTTTKFKKDALNPLADENKYPDSIPFIVKSDTTYLNLRYGPSQKYEVIMKIPNEKKIEGYGEKLDGDGNIWVYVKYDDQSGWVMKELLGAVE